jgi:hypothetical protein
MFECQEIAASFCAPPSWACDPLRLLQSLLQDQHRTVMHSDQLVLKHGQGEQVARSRVWIESLHIKNTEYLTRCWAYKLSVYSVDIKEVYPNVRFVQDCFYFRYFDLIHTGDSSSASRLNFCWKFAVIGWLLSRMQSNWPYDTKQGQRKFSRDTQSQ